MCHRRGKARRAWPEASCRAATAIPVGGGPSWSRIRLRCNPPNLIQEDFHDDQRHYRID